MTEFFYANNKFYYSPHDVSVYDKIKGEIVGACGRQVAYKFSGVMPKAVSFNMQLIGKALEDQIVNKLYASGELCCSPTGEKSNHLITGYFDNLPFLGYIDFFVKSENLLGSNFKVEQPTLVELKSTKDSAYRYMEKVPRMEHLLQIITYLKLLQTTQNKNLNTSYGILMYITRDSGLEIWWKVILKTSGKIYIQKLRSTDLRYNPSIKMGELELPFTIKDILTRMNEVQDNMQKGIDSTFPPRDFKLIYTTADLEEALKKGQLNKQEIRALNTGSIVDKADFQCKCCSYKETCWSHYV